MIFEPVGRKLELVNEHCKVGRQPPLRFLCKSGVKELPKMLVVIFREILSKFFNDNC